MLLQYLVISIFFVSLFSCCGNSSEPQDEPEIQLHMTTSFLLLSAPDEWQRRPAAGASRIHPGDPHPQGHAVIPGEDPDQLLALQGQHEAVLPAAGGGSSAKHVSLLHSALQVDQTSFMWDLLRLCEVECGMGGLAWSMNTVRWIPLGFDRWIMRFLIYKVLVLRDVVDPLYAIHLAAK